MPILLPPSTSVTLFPWCRVRFTTPQGFSYDASSQVRSVDIQRGRTSPTEKTIAQGTCSLVLDDTAGTFDPDNTASPLTGKLVPSPQSMTTVRVDAYVAQTGVYVPLFTGRIAQLTRTFTGGEYSETTARVVDSTSELVRHVPAKDTVLPAELPGARISRLLSATSRGGFKWTTRALTAPLALDSGQKILGKYTCDGNVSSWDIANVAGASEGGLVFFDPAGVLTFHGQQRRLTQTPKWTLSDAAGQIHYEQDLTFDITSDNTVVDVAVQTSDGVTSIFGPGGPSQVKANSGTNVVADMTEQGQLGGNISGASRANYLYQTRSSARRNVPAITVNAIPWLEQWTDLHGNPTAYQVALAATVSDLILVERHPAGGGSTISLPHWVEGVQMKMTAGESWTVTFNVSRADPLPPLGFWQLGVSQLGRNTTLTW